jgi:hypothetical protein
MPALEPKRHRYVEVASTMRCRVRCLTVDAQAPEQGYAVHKQVRVVMPVCGSHMQYRNSWLGLIVEQCDVAVDVGVNR